MATVNNQLVQSEQALALKLQMTEMFLAIAANPKETLLMLADKGVDQEQLLLIIQSEAKSGNQAAMEAMNAILQLAQMARRGAKLEYIKRLYGLCPEGYEMKMFKAGGLICKKCEKIAQQEIQAISETDENPVIAKFRAFRCGGKAKKKEEGGEVAMDKCGGKAKKAKCGTALKESCGGRTKKNC